MIRNLTKEEIDVLEEEHFSYLGRNRWENNERVLWFDEAYINKFNNKYIVYAVELPPDLTLPARTVAGFEMDEEDFFDYFPHQSFFHNYSEYEAYKNLEKKL
jgi:hypothetical protein